jgi:transcription elongation factor GreB
LEGNKKNFHLVSKKMANSPNYITPKGLEKLKDELRALIQDERPQLVKTVAWAASNGDRSENADYIYGKRRLREIDKRSAILTKKIEEAQVVDPAKIKSEKIVFGATVTLLDEEGAEKKYQIVLATNISK